MRETVKENLMVFNAPAAVPGLSDTSEFPDAIDVLSSLFSTAQRDTAKRRH